jgi:hypothetical protein
MAVFKRPRSSSADSQLGQRKNPRQPARTRHNHPDSVTEQTGQRSIQKVMG